MAEAASEMRVPGASSSVGGCGVSALRSFLGWKVAGERFRYIANPTATATPTIRPMMMPAIMPPPPRDEEELPRPRDGRGSFSGLD
ncbi:Uncharacterised protein [Chromobacterium violaceum]|uniref:Uncharacterized protein n=1 Tax=Chromobacterium violaceum TaxID=536 RepID=A0A3S5DLX3_CHRVL|nr:Uncharacterised protein [Chromobacterium violaceum]